MELKVASLSEKAMLVKLTTRRANLSKRDEHAEAFIQEQLDDTSLIVVSKLFRDKNNPINQLISAINEAYGYHKTHTLPYIDKGPRILPNAMYEEYTTDLRQRINKTESLKAKLMPDYDIFVQQDIKARSASAVAKGRPVKATINDYPTADEFESRMGFDIRFSPLPDRKHFLFDLSDADVSNFTQAMQDAERVAHNDAVNRMLEPLKHLVEKLNTPIGTDGSIFRDSTIENVVEGCELAKKLLIDASPEVIGSIDELVSEMTKYHGSWLRESPVVREQAAKKLDDIAKQMGAFMGAV
jgi:hypothetical protein